MKIFTYQVVQFRKVLSSYWTGLSPETTLLSKWPLTSENYKCLQTVHLIWMNTVPYRKISMKPKTKRPIKLSVPPTDRSLCNTYATADHYMFV